MRKLNFVVRHYKFATKAGRPNFAQNLLDGSLMENLSWELIDVNRMHNSDVSTSAHVAMAILKKWASIRPYVLKIESD
jgi:hypothetical protein